MIYKIYCLFYSFLNNGRSIKMKRRLVALVMLLVMLSNIFLGNKVSAYAFELREGDTIEDDENYADIEFGETEFDDDDDSNEVDDDDLDYDEALDILEENNINARFKIITSWQNHCNVEVTLENSLEEKIEDWEVRFDMEAEVENIWNAKVTNKDDFTYTIQNANWNQDIEVGQSVTFGMTLKCATDIEFPDNVFLTQECAEVLDEYEVTCREYSRWDENKVNGEITIKNLSDRVIDDWKLELETNIKIEQIWNATIEESEDNYLYLNNANYNATIPANGSVSFGFIAEVDGEMAISEYYLYDMMEVTDAETEIQNEIEDGYEREEEEFDTEMQYQAYKVVTAKMLAKSSTGSNVKDDKSGYALPAYRPKKVTIGENGIEYSIKGIKVEEFKNSNDNKPKTSKARAIQSFAKLGDKYYIAQRKGNDVLVSTCSIDSKDKKVLNFDDNSTMKLKGFAHGQSFEFIQCDGETYMLLGANVRKEFSQSLALVKYKAKTTVSVQDKEAKRITKLAYANQKRKYFGRVGRIDAALSANNKTLCVWFANDKNGDDKETIKISKVQIACFQMSKIIKYFEDNKSARSLSFQSMKKSWCNYSCEQNEKNKIIRPYNSNQGIEVSNTYKGKNQKNKMVNKNKVYFSSGDESKKKPLIIGMMTLYKKSKSDLTKNGSYRTQMRIIPEKLSFKKREMEGLHLYGMDIFFLVAPNNGEGNTTDKSKQYICSIPKTYMSEKNYTKRGK